MIYIAWAGWLWVAVGMCYEAIGIHQMVNFFPEGKRWWQIPFQMLALAHFAAVIHFNPWTYAT